MLGSVEGVVANRDQDTHQLDLLGEIIVLNVLKISATDRIDGLDHRLDNIQYL